jgi:hypothetical protein
MNESISKPTKRKMFDEEGFTAVFAELFTVIYPEDTLLPAEEDADRCEEVRSKGELHRINYRVPHSNSSFLHADFRRWTTKWPRRYRMKPVKLWNFGAL